MLIGVPLETAHGEARVALTPETAKKLKAQGHSIKVQAGAGVGASVTDAEKLPNYIVKLTPIWVEGLKIGYRLYLEGAVKVTGANAIEFQVRVLADSQIVDGSFPLAFQVEVSRF